MVFSLNVSTQYFVFIILSMIQLRNFQQTWSGVNRKFYLFASQPQKFVFINDTNTIFLSDSLKTPFQRMSRNTGEVYIRDLSTCRYICLNDNKKPRLVKSPNRSCVFKETMANNFYNYYESKIYPNTYLSANRNKLNTISSKPKKILFLLKLTNDNNSTTSKSCPKTLKKSKFRRRKKSKKANSELFSNNNQTRNY